MKLKGKITISRPTFSDGKKAIQISIIDELSWCEFLEVEMTLEDFAEALTQRGHCPCSLDFRENMPIGKKAETKHELCARPSIRATDAELDNILKPFEVDGWKGRRSDLKNHHNWRGTKVDVVFDRHVDVEEAR